MDTRTWIEAARRYVRLRRRYWLCFLGEVVLVAVFGTPLFVFADQMNSIARDILVSVLVVGFVACSVVTVITWFALVGFRCPRCGNQFMMSWTNSWPTNRCKHCGLDLGPAAMAI